MGFFKSIGSKIKRVVSLKNLVRGVTGNFSAIGADVVRVATSTDPKLGQSVPDSSVVPANFQLPPTVVDVLNSQGNTFKNKVSDVIASDPLAQKTTSLFTMVYLKSLWFKYKNWVIGFVVALVAFLLIKRVMKGKKGVRRR